MTEVQKQLNRLRIGQRIAEIRKKKGLSMRELAELTGLNHSNIGKIELGKYSVGVDILGRICDALDVRLDIIEFSNEPNKKISYETRKRTLA